MHSRDDMSPQKVRRIHKHHRIPSNQTVHSQRRSRRRSQNLRLNSMYKFYMEKLKHHHHHHQLLLDFRLNKKKTKTKQKIYAELKKKHKYLNLFFRNV